MASSSSTPHLATIAPFLLERNRLIDKDGPRATSLLATPKGVDLSAPFTGDTAPRTLIAEAGVVTTW